LALLPDLRKYKTSIVAASKQPLTMTEPAVKTQPESEAIPDAQASLSTPIEPINDLKVSDDLAEPLKSIWLFCKKKNDWVTAKDIYVNGMAVLKGKSVKNIRQYLGLLSDRGLGEIDDKDGDKPKSDSAVGFRTY
jgi:hypothetical protein